MRVALGGRNAHGLLDGFIAGVRKEGVGRACAAFVAQDCPLVPRGVFRVGIYVFVSCRVPRGSAKRQASSVFAYFCAQCITVRVHLVFVSTGTGASEGCVALQEGAHM